MSDKLDIPVFDNESQEAEWWEANSDAVENHMLRKLESGDYTLMADAAVIQTTLTLSSADFTKAKALADKQGIAYERYLETLVHRELEKTAA